MKQTLSLVTLLVDDYDDAIAHYTGALGFDLLEDTDRGDGKRWVRVAPRGSSETGPVAGQGQRRRAARAHRRPDMADAWASSCRPTTSGATTRR